MNHVFRIKNRLPLMALLALLTLLIAACSEPAPAPEPTPTPAPLQAVTVDEQGFRTFTVVTEESQASYIVKEEFFQGALEKYNIPIGNADIVGTTPTVSGQISLNLEATERLGPTRFEVDLTELTTDQRERDSWIRDNALQSNRYPTATFVANEVRNAPAAYTEGEEVTFQLVGELTVRDVTVEQIFDVTATLTGNTIIGVAETAAQITDFGFDPPCFIGTLCVENDFRIRIELTARGS